jgi:dihydroneopterin aldolase
MTEQLTVQAIEFKGHIGVTDEEMLAPQPIRVDLKLTYPQGAFQTASKSDDISKAIDYTIAIDHVVRLGTQTEYRLVERLAEQIILTLFAKFAISEATVWVRKLKPPLSDVRDSVGVCVTRTRADVLSEPAPASFLAQSTKLLHKGKILDIAAGRGRNALYLGGLGFAVDAVDRNEQSLEELAAVARQRNLTHVTTRAVDLETDSNPLSWANESYDAVIVFYYLHRPLFPHLLHAVRPGGMLIYETFLIDNHLQYQHPRRKEFCLMHNELLRLVSAFRVLHYDEGPHNEELDSERVFTARLVAQKEYRST